MGLPPVADAEGTVGWQTQTSNRTKATPVHIQQIQVSNASRLQASQQLSGVRRKTEFAGEVIGGPRRQDRHRKPVSTECVHDLVDRPIASHNHDGMSSFAQTPLDRLFHFSLTSRIQESCPKMRPCQE